MLYRSNLHSSIKIENNQKENILWLTIDKRRLGREKDLLFETVYVSPKNSTIYSSNIEMEDKLGVLYTQLIAFGDQKSIIIGRDFNARTGDLNDVIINEKERRQISENAGPCR